MQDADLFVEVAGIAGVFVGFGALIAVRSGATSDPREVAPLRAVVLAGMATIVAALTPVVLSRYDLAEHQVWAVSSLVTLVSYAGLMVLHRRAPEYRAAEASIAGRAGRGAAVENAVENAAIGIVVAGPMLALAVIAAGVVPDVEAALYLTAVAAFLVQAAWTLLWVVFMERRPASA